MPLADHLTRQAIAQAPGLGQTELIMREQGPADTPPEPAFEEGLPDAPRSDRSTVDEMGEWSLPASDPPAIWTWHPLHGLDEGGPVSV